MIYSQSHMMASGRLTWLLTTRCQDISKTFEVRYGKVIGVIEWRYKDCKIWGQMDESGKMDGLIGQMGISGATANVQQFQTNAATGTWESKGCGVGAVSTTKSS